MHSFTYVRGFPRKGFFTRLRVLTRHLRILFLSYSPVFLCIFHIRGSVRIRWRPEMRRHPEMRRCPEIGRRPEMRRHPEMRRRPDMTESPSTGSEGSLPSFVLCAFLYIERSCANIILIDNLHVYRSIYSNSTCLSACHLRS